MNLYISSIYGVIYIECTVEFNLMNIRLIMICISYSTTSCHFVHFVGLRLDYIACIVEINIRDSGYTILQDKTLLCAFEARDIVCWLVNPWIAKLDLFKTADCRWICKLTQEYCYRHSATVCRLVQSPTLQ